MSPIISRVKYASLASFITIGIMEFFGENYYLKNNLPQGFYKYQFAQFDGLKLSLTEKEVKDYWQNNQDEFDWGRLLTRSYSVVIFLFNPLKL